MKLNSPLETFEVLVYQPLNLFGELDLSITNVSFYLGIVASSLFFFHFLGLKELTLMPNWIQLGLDSFYQFLLTVVKEQTDGSGKLYFPLFYTIFFFILFSNLIGLLPFSFTVTSHFAVTFGLALSMNVGMLWLGFLKNGVSFLKLFVPSGAPAPLLPLIIVIEIVSYLIRTFSLSIRLFANMMAGHTLLHILATFTLRLGATYVFWVIPFLLILGILLLEFGIVFIQAYVFTILLTIYMNDSFHPGH
jgi:F-type H+-transporting ATPase subunit a